MRFFEPPAPPPWREPSPQPDWIGPPAGVVPGLVPVEFLLARSTEAAVAISGGWAYPTGIEFRLTILLRREDPKADDAIFSPWLATTLATTGPSWALTIGTKPLDELLRFGVQLADGRKATNIDQRDDDPAPPVLIQGGGHGNGVRWTCDYWLWPLPPVGPLAFVIEWPAKGIPESRSEIDASLPRAAAERAIGPWS